MMHWLTHPYTVALAVSVLLSASLAVAVWKTRATINKGSFCLLMVTISLWAAMHMGEVFAGTLAVKMIWANLQFACIVAAPLLLLRFAASYTRRDHLVSSAWWLAMAAFGLLIVLLVWTNPYHHWMFGQVGLVSAMPFFLLKRSFHPGFWVHTIYCYLLMLAAAALLIRSLVKAPGRYKGQVVSLLVGIIAPWVGNAIYLFEVTPLARYDLTPVLFTVSGLAFGWGIFRYRLLDIVPVAYDLMLNNMQDAVFVFDRDLRAADLNPAALELTGTRREELGRLTADQVIPGWREMAGQLAKGALRRQVCIGEGEENRFYDLSGTPLRQGEHLVGYLVILRDITQYRFTQMALVKSEKQFKSMAENAPLIIGTMDTKGIITYVNPEWERILGHPRQEVVGCHFSSFTLPEDIQNYLQFFLQVSDRKEVLSGLALTLVHHDGSKRFFNLSAAPGLDAEGRVSEIICLARDQTGERELQDQLFQSQKLEAIGTLAGGIAHDFNNLLMGIQANVSLVKMESNPGDQCLGRLEIIERQIQTGAWLSRQLLGYARKDRSHPTHLRLNELIQETMVAFGRTRKQLTLHLDLTEALPGVFADGGQMELVLLNLLVNAADAMPDGGALTVTTAMADLTPDQRRSLELGRGEHVRLQVADTGIGMEPVIRDRIFEPFFTTKEMGQGTGLGLASVYGVVKNHQGAITVASQPGAGTTFSLYFPADGSFVPEAKDANTLHNGGGHILLVDDEPELLEAGTSILTHLGYRVVGADNGFDAMRQLSENPRAFDLVILDMIMPGMGGRELYGHIRRITPDIRVLLSTGYGHTGDIGDLLAHQQSDMIRKPFTAEMLSQKIGAMMQPSLSVPKS